MNKIQGAILAREKRQKEYENRPFVSFSNGIHKTIWHKRLKKWIEVPVYRHMPRDTRDNQNLSNKLYPWVKDKNQYIRPPSKKHKNRYKNFLKMFPNYEGGTL